MEKKTIKNILKRMKLAIFLLGVLLLGISLFSVYTADLLKKIIDKLSGRVSFEELSKDVIFYVVIAILQVACLYVCNYASAVFEEKKKMDVQIELMGNAATRKGAFFSNTNSGELFQTLYADVSVSTGFVISVATRILHIVFSLIVTIGYLLYLSWNLLLLLLILQPLMIITKSILAKRVAKNSEIVRACSGKVVGSMQEAYANPADKALSGMGGFFLARTVHAMRDRFETQKKLIHLSCINGNFSELISTMSVCAVVLYGGYEVINRNMGIGTFVIFITYSQRLLSNMEALFNVSVDFSQVKPSLERVAPFFEKEDSPREILEVKTDRPDIVIDKASFSYDDKVVLTNASYRFEYGKVYGIFGKTGEGKSTLVKLLFHFWNLREGEFSIGDVNVCNVSDDDLNGLIAYYPADPIIFNDTVRENVVLGKKEIDNKKVFYALEKANMEETVKGMEQGLETNVGSNGNKLSAGEKQRLALARIFLEDKKVLILDEPTSAMDRKTARFVMDNVLKHMSGKLVIMITHDMDLLDRCDVKVHLENGVLE